MARKQDSDWSSEKSPEEVASAVAKWIVEGSAGPSPVQQLEDAAAKQETATDDPELSDSLLGWLSEGIAENSEQPAPAPELPEEEEEGAAAEEAEAQSDAEPIIPPPPPEEETAPEAAAIIPPPPEGTTDPKDDFYPEESEEQKVAPAPQAPRVADRSAFPMPPPEPTAQDPDPANDSVLKLSEGDEISPDAEQETDRDPIDTEKARIAALAAEVSSAWQGAKQLDPEEPDDEAIEDTAKSAAPPPPRDRRPARPERREPVLGRPTPPPVEPPTEQPPEQMSEPDADEIDGDADKVIPFESARQTDTGVPTELRAMTESWEAGERARELHAERLAQPIPETPPKVNTWSRGFTIIVGVLFFVTLGAIGFFTLQMLSEPPNRSQATPVAEPPAAATPPGTATTETGGANPPAQKSAAQKAPGNTVASVFDTPPPVKDAPPVPAPAPVPVIAPQPTPQSAPQTAAKIPAGDTVAAGLASPPPEPKPAEPVARPDTPAAAPVPVPPRPPEPVPAPRLETAPPPTPAPAPVASAPPPAQPAPKPVASNDGPYEAQLGAVREPAIARREQARLSAALQDVLGGNRVSIIEAEIAGRGKFYRLRVVGFKTHDAAREMCAKVKAKNLPCVPLHR